MGYWGCVFSKPGDCSIQAKDESYMTTPNERPRNWVQDHMARYLETGGEDRHIWSGVPTLLLTTTGRNSGKPYTTPLIYGQDGDR